MDTTQRDTVNALLTKLGVEQPGRFDDERAAERLKKKLTIKGVPADVTAEEKELIAGLGFNANPETLADETAPDAGTAKKEKVVKKDKKGGKSAKVAKEPKAGKTPKPAKEPKAAKTLKPADKKPAKSREGSPADLFRKTFASMKGSVAKDDLIKTLTDAGAKPESAKSYISWAKRTKAGKASEGNPWPFVIEEYVKYAGEGEEKVAVKMLRKVSNF